MCCRAAVRRLRDENRCAWSVYSLSDFFCASPLSCLEPRARPCRWASSDFFQRAAAASKSPTWLWHDFQVELDLWPPGNHGIAVRVFLGDVSDGQRVPVAVSGDRVSAARDKVLWVALPFHFSVRLLGLSFKDHGGPLHRLLALWFLGEGWNWVGAKMIRFGARRDLMCNDMCQGDCRLWQQSVTLIWHDWKEEWGKCRRSSMEKIKVKGGGKGKER